MRKTKQKNTMNSIDEEDIIRKSMGKGVKEGKREMGSIKEGFLGGRERERET